MIIALIIVALVAVGFALYYFVWSGAGADANSEGPGLIGDTDPGVTGPSPGGTDPGGTTPTNPGGTDPGGSYHPGDTNRDGTFDLDEQTFYFGYPRI